MQSASSNFTRAASGSAVTWRRPTILADWDNDGTALTADKNPLWAADRFGRTETAGWGTAETGQPWVTQVGAATNYMVNGIAGQAAATTSTPNDPRQTTLAVGATDCNISATVNVSVMASGAAIQVGFLARRTDGNNQYRYLVAFGTDQTLQAFIVKRVAGVDTTLATASLPNVPPHKVGRSYRIRSETLGTTHKLKVWGVSQPEPTSWSATASDGSLTGAGDVGCHMMTQTGNLNGTVTAYFDDFVACTADLDQLSHRAGTPVEIKHYLDDGLPNEVSFVGQLGTAEATVPLVGGVGQQTPRQTYSPYQALSPLRDKHRDTAPVTVDANLVTTNGIEGVRVFTGQMIDLPVKAQGASMGALSARRLQLSTQVQPPTFFDYLSGGLTATWPISWALAQAGIYVSPPPRDGCRLWMPMHGSAWPFLPSRNIPPPTFDGFTFRSFIHTYTIDADNYPFATALQVPDWVAGPFLLAPSLYTTPAGLARYLWGIDMDFEDGDDMISKAGNAGRLEFWARGDVDNISAWPTAGDLPPDNIVEVFCRNDTDAASGSVRVGLGLDRKAFVTIDDGTNTRTFKSTGTLPTDGGWYFVGAAWDITANKLWVRLKTTTETNTPSPAMTTTNLPIEDLTLTSGLSRRDVKVHLPIAELQLTTGTQANPDNYPWLPDVPFTVGARIEPSQLKLKAMIEPQPREAWELIGAYAQAELASLRTDENDLILYLARSFWTQTTQQTVVDAYSTTTNVGDVNVRYDPSKIRNSIVVKYRDTSVPLNLHYVYTSTTVVTLPPGVTDLPLLFNQPIVRLGFSKVILYGSPTSPIGAESFFDFVTVNSSQAGDGVYATDAEFFVYVLDADAAGATIRFQNKTGVTWYLANGYSYPVMGFIGYDCLVLDAAVSSVDRTSVALRGERTLVVSLPQIQDSLSARRAAHRLRCDLRQPVAVIEDVSIFGDPRRQPGDLVTFEDQDGDTPGVWRPVSIVHRINGAGYTQSVTVKAAKTTGQWGRGAKWGKTLWKG